MGGRRGAAYVLALTTLLVGVTLALAMLRSAGGYFIEEDTRTRMRAAINIAEAGVDYAYWRVHYQNQTLPYSADISLGGGSCRIEAADDGARDPSTMLVTSTATYRGHRYTLKRVLLGLLPYHYTWTENRNCDDGDAVTSSGPKVGIRANGGIKLDHLKTNVTTGGWATAQISSRGTITPQYPNTPPVAFPEIDYAYYAGIATHSYSGDRVFASLLFPSGSVVYVNGQANVSGAYQGYLTLVATGDIIVTAPLTAAAPDSFLALITTRLIKVESAATTIDAILYAHKPDNRGKIDLCGLKLITGCIAADDIVTDHAIDMIRRPAVTTDVLRRLRLPGL